MEFWVAFIVIAIAWWLSRRQHGDMEEQLENLSIRLEKAEGELSALRRGHATLVAKLEQRTQPVTTTTTTTATEPLANARVILVDAPPAPDRAAPTTLKPPAPTAPPLKSPAPVMPPPPRAPASAPPRTPQQPQGSEVPLTSSTVSDYVRQHPISHPPTARVPQPSLFERLRSSFDLEEKLGANYLAKLGASSVVIGIALFLIYQFGGTPSGKVFLGYLGGALGLAGGFWLERNDRYKPFARSLMGGGWALVYFTTYAMYHVAAARVITSQPLDLVLMLVIAACMVAHTLRYRSQVVTGLAFTLAFLTVTISHSDVYSLSAGAVLALALVVITARLRWFELELLGLLGAYINHFLWLMPYVREHTLLPQLFIPSTALLVFYWAAFRASYIVRKIQNAEQESISTIGALLNSALLLGLMKYQSLHPEWAFYALVAFGVIELALGQLPITHRRRTAFLILTTIGVTLIVAAIPFRYSNATLSLTWLIFSQMLLIAGILTREVHFRRLGVIAATAATAVIVYQAGLARGWDLIVKVPGVNETLVFSLAAVLFYLDAHLLPRIWRERITSDFEQAGLRLLSYFAFALTLATVAVSYDLKWFAISAAVLALAFAILAARLRDFDFIVQAPLYSVVAIVCTAALNTYTVETHLHLTFRAIAYIAVATMLYAAAFFHGRTDRDESLLLRSGHTWMASILIGALIWFEVPAQGIGVAWMGFALLLAAASRVVKLPGLNLQSNAAAIAAIVRVALVNLPATGLYHHDSVRVVTILSVAAALYAASRWADTEPYELTHGISHIYTGAASTLITLLAWYELQPTSTVPAWTAFALLLFEIGMVLKSASLRVQGYAVLTAAFVRIFFVNLNAAGGGWLSPRMYTVVPVALALYYVYARIISSRDSLDRQEFKLADFSTWFAAITVASLLRFEIAPDWVAASWAVLLVALIVAASLTKRIAFAYQAIVVAGAVIVRGLMYNIAQRSSLVGEHAELLPVGAAVIITLCALPFAFYLRKHPAEHATKSAPRALVLASDHPEQFFFFIPVALVTVLLWVELPAFRTMAWGIEGMLVFLLALWAGERSFRFTGLGLLLLCIAKIVLIDAWSMQPRDRYLTLIVVGMVLLTVSFLYNRYREALRKLL